MYDKEDDTNHERYCNIALTSTPGATSTLGAKISLPAHQTSIQPEPITTTEVVWDTGATGSIVKTAEILTSCQNCDPILYNGLQGSLTIDKVGQLRDIGLVHCDPRAHISILSASDCWLQGLDWEFKRGNTINDDAFLLHTHESTYRFKHRDGLYICDMAIDPEPRHLEAPPSRNSRDHVANVCKKQAILLCSTKLPTTAANEAKYSKREVQRSVEARRLQASLGFPPDKKLIAALNAGSFMNCTVIAADVTRATAIWGPQVAALKGRTTRSKPMPPPQEPEVRRRFVAQHMYCDIMSVNKIAVVHVTEECGQAALVVTGELGDRHAS
jgi:hypothetical protein